MKDQDCWDMQPDGVSSLCVYHGNPIAGTFNFDNILYSIMNIFQVITLEGWTDMMYTIRQSEQTYIYDFLFILIVVFGAFFVLNLMIAV